MNPYHVISVSVGFSQKKAIETLMNEVNQAVVRGWRPVGGVVVSGSLLLQTMLKDR